MKKRLSLTLLAALVITSSAFAQDSSTQKVRPMFMRIPAHGGVRSASKPPASLATWTGTYNFVGDGGNMTITEVGASPVTSNVTTTIPVVIIPIGFAIKSGTKVYKFSPATKLSNGNTVIQNTLNSPIFSTGIDFVQGGTDLGNTQYEDAYQRGNFWTNVMTNTSFHLILGTPKVEPVQFLNVPKGKGVVGNPFGKGTRGEVDLTYFDGQVQTLLTKLGITPNELPIFEYYNTFLTSGGCCIGGYHSADTNGQTYSTIDYDSGAGSFSQDVSALSHEIGEWIVDPLITDFACGGLMENGDPLEGEANYGGYPYTLNGFTYNLQDLVFLQYFGQSPSTSVNAWESFQDAKLTTCSNGQ